jgi:hypothetical protein
MQRSSVRLLAALALGFLLAAGACHAADAVEWEEEDEVDSDEDVPSSTLPAFVIQLGQDTFEDQTQAATGQTTGRWWVVAHTTRLIPLYAALHVLCVPVRGSRFVLFNSRLNHRAAVVSALWSRLAQDEDKGVIFAEVFTMRVLGGAAGCTCVNAILRCWISGTCTACIYPPP